MAFIIKDRVKETTTTTGTGDLSLGGASSTFDQFQTYMSNGDTTYYAIATTESGVDEWEVGIGTWNTGNTLTRTTILAGSNSTSAVNFTAGDKQVFMTYPAAKAAFFNADGDLDLTRDPQTALQAATKQYVDTIAAAGIHYHDPVRVEQEGNLSATYSNGTAGVGATLTNNSTQAALSIDGVTLSLNDRVLIYEQTNSYENGIYTVTDTGSASTNWVLTRATDADSYGASDPDALGQGDAFFVQEGGAGAGELYVMNTEGAITFGTTAITFTQVAATAVYTAGNGLSLTGTEFSIGAGTGVTVDSTSVSIGQAVSTSDTPTFAGLTSTANISLGDDDKVLLGASNDLEIYHEGATGDSHIVNNGTGDLKVSSNLSFGDNDKAIFGAGSDLQIYHDGSNSYISDQGTGSLNILAATEVAFLDVTGTEYVARFNDNADVKLYYDNSKKLATTSTGVDITGTLTSDGLTVDLGNLTDVDVNGTDGGGIQFSYNGVHQVRIDSGNNDGGVYHAPTGKNHTFKTDGKNRLKIGDSGDISFYEDTGTTPKFFWDASAESLGIGTSSPFAPLQITHANGRIGFNAGNTSGGTKIQLFTTANADGYLAFEGYTKEYMRIDSSGNVGIGTSSPDGTLHLKDAIAQLYLQSNDGQPAQVVFGDVSDASRGRINYDSSDNLIFEVSNLSEAMRIDSSGNVGIGTVPDTDWWSAVTALQIDDAGSISQNGAPNGRLAIALNAKQTGSSYITGWEYQTTDEATQYLQIDGSHIWKNAASGTADTAITWSESMRIDASGNLLVGTTNSTPHNLTSGGGLSVRGSINLFSIARQDNEVMIVNRTGTDGDIALFRKDGTTVGSIGSSSSQMYIGYSDTGIRFTATADDIRPWNPNTGVIRDAAIDLGDSAGRFKHLYLAGQAKLIPGTSGDAIVELGDPAQVEGGPHGFKFYKQGGSTNDHYAFYYRTGDNTYNFESLNAATQLIKIAADTGKSIFNYSGRNDADFQVKSDTEDYMLFVDASTNYVSFGTNATDIGSSSSGEGVTYRNGESLRVQRASGPPIIANRVTDDGSAYEVRKNGAGIGYVGNDGSRLIIRASVDGQAIIFSSDDSTGSDLRLALDGSSSYQQAFRPYNSYSDAKIDLGASTVDGGLQRRFRNAYFSGTIYAASKSFEIDHPTKEGMRLRHGSLEGPEDAVYVRGKLTGDDTIQLPDYWTGLVHEDSITVQLTAIGGKSDLWVENIGDNTVTVGCDTDINCFYFIQATRKDVDAWDVEYEA